jgi:A nuclease family of the HNH/ENDO VII superfamily with conserved AHH
LLAAALSVGVFWGCSKEETLNSVTTSTNDAIPAIRKISVDDVKKWYKEPVASGSLGSRSDGIKTALGAVPLFPIAFQTTGTHIDSVYNGKVEYVITPVKASSLIPTSRFQGNFLLFNRSAQGNIESELVVFYADEEAYKDSTRVISFGNFTGQMIFLDENNKVRKYQKMVNGVVVQKNYSSLSLKVVSDGLKGDNNGGGLSSRCDDSGPGSCYNGWGTSGWNSFWGAVGGFFSRLAGSGSGGGDARSFGSSVNDGFDSDLSYVQANRSPHASDNGGGGPETNPKQIWCTNLLSGWQDDKLQAVLDGEIPASHYNGYITTTSRAELEFRNKLRVFQAVMQCEHVHKMNEMPEFTNTAYDYYVAKGRSAIAREKIAEVITFLAEHPEHTNVVNDNAPNYFNKYNVANFSISEFVKLASDPQLFAQVDGFLNSKGFTSENKEIVNLHKDLYDSNDLNYKSQYNSSVEIGSDQWEQQILNPILDVMLAAQYSFECAILKKEHPSWSKVRVRLQALWNIAKDAVHTGLDICGLIPLAGEPCDLVNGLFYVIEGDGFNATMSLCSTVPIVGWIATGAKYSSKVVKTATGAIKNLPYAYDAVTKIISFGKRADLRTVLNITDAAKEAHHIIPWGKSTNPLVQKAAAAARKPFHMNHAGNGIEATKFRIDPTNTGTHANHPEYDKLVERDLKVQWDALIQAHGSADAIPANDARDALIFVQNRIRAIIDANPNVKINDLSWQ